LSNRRAKRKDVSSPQERKHALELKYQFRFRIIELISHISDQLIPGTIAVLIVYFGIFRTAHELANKHTVAAFSVRLLADVKPDELISYAAAVAGWVFGVNAQRLRRNSTERLTKRIQELEQRINPHRTTSGLTPRGLTPPEVE